MKLRFIGDGETCEVFGHKFCRYQWVGPRSLADDEIERLSGNPTFEVKGGDAPAEVEPEPEPESEPDAT